MKQSEQRGVLVVGGGIAGMQSALDLAESGFQVFLVEKQSAIGGRMVQLDKTFPTNDCSMCTISPRLVQIGLHPNIQILTNTTVETISGESPQFTATLKYHPRFVDPQKCKACGACESVCPVTIPNNFDTGLSTQKAVFKLYPQATPNAYAIQKKGWAPCKSACPAHVNTQGYVALIRQGKFKEALALIRRDLPLPSICGRACARPCETACEKGHGDQGAVAIRALKRFVADLHTDPNDIDLPIPENNDNPKKIGIIGSGPAGLSAAWFLALKGHHVTIFESQKKPGGMLRYGVPAFRLPRDVVDAEINTILSLGITLKTETALGEDFTTTALFDSGYDALFLATGLHQGRRLGIEGEDLPGIFQGVDFLRSIESQNTPVLGSRVVVIGGGNVAIDAARCAVRLGATVTIICRKKREAMRAHPEEIAEALEEGVVIEDEWGPRQIEASAAGLNIRFQRCVTCLDSDGRLHTSFDDKETITLQADALVLAIGQIPDPDLPAACELSSTQLTVDPITLKTARPHLFAGGDLVSGPKTIIEAVAMGRRAAEAIDADFQGTELDRKWPHILPKADAPKQEQHTAPRHEEKQINAALRRRNFDEISMPLTPEEAMAEAARCLSCADCSECRQCEAACESNAINHDDRERIYDLNVGAVIAAPGFDQFDIGRLGEFGFGRYQNVLSSLSLERMLSASGPTGGHIERPSDNQQPKRIAWIQCVGSRDTRQDRHYCSAVCCMFATKQSLIIRDHFPDISATIFYMDMRAYGKGFDAYVKRAKEQFNVRYERAMISKVYALPNHDLEITYRNEDGIISTEVFDMVVLSSGLTPNQSVKNLAKATDISLNSFGFASRRLLAPNRTKRDGIFVAGVIEGPKDIPETVMSAASAASLAASTLAAERGVGLAAKTYPPERDVEGETPRIGVFICRCGVNIARVVDVPSLTEYAKTLRDVVFAEENLYTCSADTQTHIAEKIKEHRLNRVIVASCTPRTHEPLFQETLRNAGLNKYLFEMANIRDQCAWVHANDEACANKKAKDLVRMAVGRARRLTPLQERHVPVVQHALVVGGGLSGMTAAHTLSRQGYGVTLIEKSEHLGGNFRHITALESGEDPISACQELTEKIEADERLQILTEAQLIETTGHIGNFISKVKWGDTIEKVSHGVTIVASGGSAFQPEDFYGFGQDDRITTQIALEERLLKKNLPQQRVVMIQCVGSRTGETPVCSRVCCTQAIKNAIRIKQLNSKANVTILYRDIRTYGLRETLYRDARELGVLFVRFNEEAPPQVIPRESIEVTATDLNLKIPLSFKADLLVLSTGITPQYDAEKLATVLKLPRGEDGFFSEAHMKLRPLDFASDGIYLCGLAHGPKLVDESLAQAQGAAARAATILSKTSLPLSSEISVVDQDHCVGCLTCVRSCPYGVPQIGIEKTAFIEPAACQGCGICAAACPRKAIATCHSTDEQIMAEVDSLFEGDYL